MSVLYRIAGAFIQHGADAPLCCQRRGIASKQSFERIADVDPETTQEIVVSHAPRAYPLDVVAFDDDANRARRIRSMPKHALPALPTSVATASNKPTQAQTAPAVAVRHRARREADRRLSGAATKPQLQVRTVNTFLLASEDGRLQRSKYIVVFHRAWIQPVPDRDQLRPEAIQIRERSDGLPRIEGILGVTRGRYLHLDARLWYAVSGYAVNASRTALAPADPGAAEEPGYMELRDSAGCAAASCTISIIRSSEYPCASIRSTA
jgi:hypothetical protein